MSIRDRLFLGQVRHVRPDPAGVRTAAVCRQIRRDFGALVPPFALHLPVPEALAACWAILREPSHGRRVDRASKEAVAAAVSASNACPYCVDVHTTTLHALGGRRAAAAIASARLDAITDPDTRALVAWASATTDPYAESMRRPPFAVDQAPELIGVAVGFHYINRMVNVFAAPSPFPTTARILKPIMRRVAAPAFRGLLARPVQPGASLDLLPPADLPDDLAWAQSDPVIATAFARAAGAFEAVGRRALPEPVRDLVTARLATWRGQPPGLSPAWVDATVAALPESQRAQARLALLVAFASYQVGARVLDQARTEPGPAGDETLVAAAAWSSFAAARRIGSWLQTTPQAARCPMSATTPGSGTRTRRDIHLGTPPRPQRSVRQQRLSASSEAFVHVTSSPTLGPRDERSEAPHWQSQLDRLVLAEGVGHSRRRQLYEAGRRLWRGEDECHSGPRQRTPLVTVGARWIRRRRGIGPVCGGETSRPGESRL